MVETKELWQTVVSSLVAGVGITGAFSLMILGIARSADFRRQERNLAASAAAGMALLALAITLGGIALGLTVMLSK